MWWWLNRGIVNDEIHYKHHSLDFVLVGNNTTLTSNPPTIHWFAVKCPLFTVEIYQFKGRGRRFDSSKSIHPAEPALRSMVVFEVYQAVEARSQGCCFYDLLHLNK